MWKSTKAMRDSFVESLASMADLDNPKVEDALEPEVRDALENLAETLAPEKKVQTGNKGLFPKKK